MTWRGIDGRFLTVNQFKDHVANLIFKDFKPIGIVWHNTASPTLKRWHEFTRQHWMNGLASYYKGLGWSAGPHLFIDDGDDGIGLFTPLNIRGTHSPSFNAQYIGIEHVGDYSSEDDDVGLGLKVKQNGIAATAILCNKLGIDPLKMIKLHKEDPRTNHDCPGKDMAQDKGKSVQAVLELMGEAGDHAPNWGDLNLDGDKNTLAGIVQIDGLNIRSQSNALSVIMGTLNKGDKVSIVSEAMNGKTKWLSIKCITANKIGWVAAKYIKVL